MVTSTASATRLALTVCGLLLTLLLAARAGDAAALTPLTLADALHATFLASVGALLVGAVLVMLLRVRTVRAPGPVPPTDSRQAVAEPNLGGAGQERGAWATRV
jgi:hypothetical protein